MTQIFYHFGVVIPILLLFPKILIELVPHDIDLLSLNLAAAMVLLTATVCLALYRRKKNTGIRALNLLIYLFLSLSILGIFQLLQILAHDVLFFFPTNDSDVPLILSPVRLANLVVILILYSFANNILESRVNPYRLSLLISLISGIIIIGFVGYGQGSLITTNLLIPFASNTRLDEFFFDILQFYVVLFVTYLFVKQYQFSESDQYRRYIGLLIISAGWYLGAMTIEVFEHISGGERIDSFISAFPTIALLAYVYLRYPNLVYLVPTNVRFLQLIGVKSGIPVYVAEFDEEEKAMDFLIGPGLSSIRTMLQELLVNSSNQNSFSLKSFEYSNGYLIFEESAGLFALLQADKLSRALLTSLSYFIKEFESTFGDQLRPFKGKIKPVNGVSPDDLLRRCVPIVQAKPIISSIRDSK